MNTTYKLVEIVKKNTGIESDYGIAKLIGVTRAVVSSWKQERAEANVTNTLKLMKAAGLSIDDALKIMTKEAENARPASNDVSGTVYIM
jgi:predicted transcriptional regulator